MNGICDYCCKEDFLYNYYGDKICECCRTYEKTGKQAYDGVIRLWLRKITNKNNRQEE